MHLLCFVFALLFFASLSIKRCERYAKSIPALVSSWFTNSRVIPIATPKKQGFPGDGLEPLLSFLVIFGPLFRKKAGMALHSKSINANRRFSIIINCWYIDWLQRACWIKLGYLRVARLHFSHIRDYPFIYQYAQPYQLVQMPGVRSKGGYSTMRRWGAIGGRDEGSR